MTDDARIERRRFVQLTATAAVTTVLAGCSGGDADDRGGSSGGDDGADTGDEHLADEPDYGGWFDDVDGYDGTVDATGNDRVSVTVGSDGGLSYSPAAVAVSPGTTVVWEWTGDGGAHDVSAVDGGFESESVDDEGFTFEHTFEAEGVHEYVCTPHEAVGMKGAVVVQ
ncbi:halocyanin domain-containing protein [Halorubrum sp. JWXQ-INN 858]|uniref:halocyanin domain-containing protein n=1 Tax=Halorubrum sp. JWXQ-INN 858 TaxID=2690782 RepID=UPI0013593643|nr:halocyanin domain-containing protein [Halorubrum sp. JWXQ-INN 858]MWV65375.1 halocyanin domain-containing protein [Halorubrum sp. JWXQ-INN 858]